MFSTGVLKMTDMKMMDMKLTDMKMQDMFQVSEYCLHGIEFDLAVLPSNRLLLRFQECSRSKSKLKTIRLYSDDHCVFHAWICLSIILQLQEVYTTYFAAVTCILPLF